MWMGLQNLRAVGRHSFCVCIETADAFIEYSELSPDSFSRGACLDAVQGGSDRTSARTLCASQPSGPNSVGREGVKLARNTWTLSSSNNDIQGCGDDAEAVVGSFSRSAIAFKQSYNFAKMPPSRLAQLRELDRKGQLYEAVNIVDGPGSREVKPSAAFEDPSPYISTRTVHNYGYDVLDRGQSTESGSTKNHSSR